ncbi:MAG: hypothetical protein COA43_00505 [Robiginitomaculum sp.]|nr:MAG: hypothetical protein COA43_00505 [Robiginitomaculum sp.]
MTKTSEIHICCIEDDDGTHLHAFKISGKMDAFIMNKIKEHWNTSLGTIPTNWPDAYDKLHERVYYGLSITTALTPIVP